MLDFTEDMPEPERSQVRGLVVAEAMPPPTSLMERLHDGREVVEVWAHGPVVRYRYGGPHPSGLNRHERRAAEARARKG